MLDHLNEQLRRPWVIQILPDSKTSCMRLI